MTKRIENLKAHFYYPQNQGSLRVRIWHPDNGREFTWAVSQLDIPVPTNTKIDSINGRFVTVQCEVTETSISVL